MEKDKKVLKGCGCLASIVLGATLALVGIPLLGNGCNNYIVAEGDRVGTINKFSKKGIIWQSYEGTMALEGLTNQGANLWDFSIDRQARNGENTENLALQIQEYLDSQNKVKVHYKSPWALWPWRADTHYLIQEIKEVGKKK